MDGRYRGSAARRESWASNVVKERDREMAVAVRARQRVIGRELRRMYDEVVQEPVPPDFLMLLGKIDEAKDKKDTNA
jgi:hypothetical protein